MSLVCLRAALKGACLGEGSSTAVRVAGPGDRLGPVGGVLSPVASFASRLAAMVSSSPGLCREVSTCVALPVFMRSGCLGKRSLSGHGRVRRWIGPSDVGDCCRPVSECVVRRDEPVCPGVLRSCLLLPAIRLTRSWFWLSVGTPEASVASVRTMSCSSWRLATSSWTTGCCSVRRLTLESVLDRVRQQYFPSVDVKKVDRVR